MKSFKYLVLVLFVAACDDRYDFANKDDQPPKIYFKGAPSLSILSDSLKTGNIKTGKLYYSLIVNAKDFETPLTQIGFKAISGGKIKFVDDRSTSDISSDGVAILSSSNDAVIDLYPEIGTSTVQFSATDKIGKTSIAKFTLFTFVNLPPVAIVKFNATKQSGPYEYEFDATSSYDQDHKQGGLITEYEYIINDTYTILTDKKKIKYVFSGPGGYRVKYRVHDNEGATSDWIVSDQITL